MSDVTTTVSETVRDILNKADPNELADALRKFGGLGELLTVLLNQSAASTPPATTVGGVVANTGVVTQAAVTYTVADQTALANCVLALVVQINLLRADVIAMRASLASCAAGTVGGLTETHLAPASNVVTLAATPKAVFNVNVTSGTKTGIFKLVGPDRVPTSGEVSWNGLTKLTFNAADVVAYIDVVYSKATGTSDVSALLKPFSPSS